MTKATETELGALHAQVAKTIGKALTAPIYDKDGGAIDGTEGLGASPAMVGAAIAFLKNNNIVADPEKNDALKNLREVLENRRKSSKLLLLNNRSALTEVPAYLRLDGDESTGE